MPQSNFDSRQTRDAYIRVCGAEKGAPIDPKDIATLLFHVSRSEPSASTKQIKRVLSNIENCEEIAKSIFFNNDAGNIPENKDVTIVIRTYVIDFVWLPLLFQSIEIYAEECEVLVICSKEDYLKLREFTPNKYKIEVQNQFCDGSIHQKYSKLTADLYVDTEYILYMDSDTAFAKKLDLKQWFFMGQPILEYTSYADIKRWLRRNTPENRGPEIWRSGVAHAIGRDLEYEFSRRIEKIYRVEWILQAREFLEQRFGYSLTEFIKRQAGTHSHSNRLNVRYFSDFNFLGAYIWFHHRNEVAWIDTNVWDFWARPINCVQFHSFTMAKVNGGNRKITNIPIELLDNIKSELERKDIDEKSKSQNVIDIYSNFRSKHRY